MLLYWSFGTNPGATKAVPGSVARWNTSAGLLLVLNVATNREFETEY